MSTQVRITEAPKDYTVVYDDTEESSALEEEFGGGEGQAGQATHPLREDPLLPS